MPDWRNTFLNFAIARSFKVKSIILFSGAGLILFGSELRRTEPIVGSAIYFIGLIVDWGIIYLVYVEITRIRNETSGISERAFDRFSRISPPFDTLESKVSELEKEVGMDFAHRGSLRYRINDLEGSVEDIERSLDSTRF